MDSGNHQIFLENLKESERVRWLVAQWIMSHNFPIQMFPTEYAPTYEEWKRYADGGDIYFLIDREWKRAEAKGLSADFTCLEDWPFDDFIVCQRHSFDRARPKPTLYVCLNKARTHVAYHWVRNTRNHWWVEERDDRRYEDYRREYYICEPEKVRFGSLYERN